jgi:NAD(P)H-hydrate epimerase
MERAAMACVSVIMKSVEKGKEVMVFTGPGNNGGDGWAVARLLAGHGYRNVSVFHLNISDVISPDSQVNRQRLTGQGRVGIFEIDLDSALPEISTGAVVIDAIFGAGLSRPLAGLPARVVRHINASGCHVISIDIPSGLMGEDNTGNDEKHIIRAAETLTFQFPKRCFFYPENEKFTGRWQVLDIGLHPDAIRMTASDYHYLEAPDVATKIMKRPRFSHKGTYGHALFIAGSYGMMGAAILGARACMRTGTGLLTTHVPEKGYPVIQGCVPESIFSIDSSELCFSDAVQTGTYQAVGAGPGIGNNQETVHALEMLLKECEKPLVLDADGLNILAGHQDMMQILRPKTIITPHPGEFDRLFGSSSSGYRRNMKQMEMSAEHHTVIVLKGAFTSVALPDGRCFFNSTGNPGMSTAGSGDVLTGMILSLLAQGYDPEDAAITGTYVHGMAGDLAAEETGCQALVASDIINHIGKAFIKLKDYEN